MTKHTKATMEKINAHIKCGAEIIENANARYTGKRAGYTRVVRLAQTNSRHHGWPINVVWACYRGETIRTGDKILARVTHCGSNWGPSAWAYSWYEAKLGTKTGYIYCNDCTGTMFPNNTNYARSNDLEAEYRADGVIVIQGRPDQRKGSPRVVA